jgi:hypothetical protein
MQEISMKQTSNLKIKAVPCPETLMNCYWTTWLHIPEDNTLHKYKGLQLVRVIILNIFHHLVFVKETQGFGGCLFFHHQIQV